MPRTAQPPRLLLRKKPGREPVYVIRWTEGGRTVERSTGTSERGSAEELFAQWLMDRPLPAMSGPRRPHEMAIADALALYIEEHGATVVSKDTLARNVRTLLDWWGESTVDRVVPAKCTAYVRYRATKGAGNSTSGRELSVLSAALHHAEKNNHLTRAPHVALPEKPPGRDRWLTRDEVAKLLNAARKTTRARRHFPLYLLLRLYTGARPDAIFDLRWTQVDLVNGLIDLNPPGRVQTSKRRPRIPIPRGLLAALRRAYRHTVEWYRELSEKALRKGKAPPAPCSYVVHHHGKPVRSVNRAWRDAIRKSGLRGVVPYTLRHTAGTWMAQAGVPMWQIAGWLGHSVSRTTELYAHHHPDYLAEAKAAFDKAKKRPRGTK